MFKLLCLIKLHQPPLYLWPIDFNNFMEWSDTKKKLWKQSDICLDGPRFPGPSGD